MSSLLVDLRTSLVIEERDSKVKTVRCTCQVAGMHAFSFLFLVRSYA